LEESSWITTTWRPCGRASTASGGGFDLVEKQQQIAALEERAADPDLWSNPQEAQGVMQRLTRLKEDVERWTTLEGQIATLADLQELAATEEDDSLREEIAAEFAKAQRTMDELEVELLLGGAYDDRDAFLSIKAGMGGTDAQDWAAMMLRMYTRWAENHGYKVALIDESEGDEAGIKSATLELRGTHAYGYAKAEAGVHRLIRLSPFNSGNTRQTSFALVEVLPEVDDAPEVTIRPDDLRIDVFRSGGHGGQGVNTTDSAVRITYKAGTPEQIVVVCQNERSQIQNRETAMRVLRGRLLERELQRQREERARLKGEHRQADFGSQMRTYYLHPYTLVKDHRSEHETSNVQAVLDGDLDPFMEAYLRWNIGRDGGE
jgi:peptide chain release factor 2